MVLDAGNRVQECGSIGTMPKVSEINYGLKIQFQLMVFNFYAPNEAKIFCLIVEMGAKAELQLKTQPQTIKEETAPSPSWTC